MREEGRGHFNLIARSSGFSIHEFPHFIGNLELLKLARLDRLVEGKEDFIIFHFGGDDLWRERYFFIVEYETVEAKTDTLSDFFLAKGMDVDGLT